MLPIAKNYRPKYTVRMYSAHTAIRIIVAVAITVSVGLVVQTYRKPTLIHLALSPSYTTSGILLFQHYSST